MFTLTRRKHSVYIILTAVLATVSLVIVCTSFATEDWVRATAKPTIDGPLPSNINYGLFKGTLMRRPVYSPYTYDLYFTCIWSENSCAWSCVDGEDSRKNEVQHLIDGDETVWSCIPKRSEATFSGLKPRASRGTNKEKTFINGGLWLSTVIFLALLTLALLVSVVLSVLNCITSPAETFFNVHGIFVANGIALCTNFLVLLLYGICYGVYIDEDIAIYDTLVGQYTSEAALGYSYWILLVPLSFEAVGIFLIAMREKIVNSDRAETHIDVATDVPETGVLF